MKERTIYVAGSSREIDTIERCIAKLRDAGWTITHDWCASMRACPVPEAALSEPQKARYALDDHSGVIAADVFWLLAPQAPSVGAWVELGAAITLQALLKLHGTDRMVIVSRSTGSIFEALATGHFAEHEDALDYLCAMSAADDSARPEAP